MKLNEIKKIHQDHFDGGKGEVMRHHVDDVRELEQSAKNLPGGSHFTWNMDKQGPNMAIYIFDPEMDEAVKEEPNDPNVIGSLALTKDSHGWGVNSITVFEEYRGKRIGLSLYGLALDTLKLTVTSDMHQTPGGQKMWKSIASIPGTKVQGVFSSNGEFFSAKKLTEKGIKLWKSMKSPNLKDFVQKIGGDYSDSSKRFFAVPVKVENDEVTNEYIHVYGSYFVELIASRS